MGTLGPKPLKAPFRPNSGSSPCVWQRLRLLGGFWDFRVLEGLGFRLYALTFRVLEGLGFRLYALTFRVLEGLGFFRVWGFSGALGLLDSGFRAFRGFGV